MGIKEDLKLKDIEFEGKDDILGKNILTMGNRINSSRANMVSNQLDQVVPLKKVDKPYVFTNYENTVGKYSSSYYKAHKDLLVVNKIVKFPISENSVYILVVYDKEKNIYDVILKEPGERLTETYGYRFETEKMDNLKVNDEIKKGDVLYHSTSFDDDLMFGYGLNAKTLYTSDPMTIEDAGVISKSFSKKLDSIEYDVVRITINQNDILINLYGDKDNYKAFPDIGEHVKNSTIAVRRRISYEHSLFDLKEENMRKQLNTDTAFYVPFATDRIVDISVKSNRPFDEIKKSKYNTQLLKYLENDLSYYQSIVDALGPIIENGNYTNELSFQYSRARKILDDDIKWKDKDGKVFDNIILEFFVEKIIGAAPGLKLTGRYGNKFTVSEIRDDEDMPILENGQRVDVISNILGVGNRLNISQLFECEINFLSNCISNLMKSTDDIKLREYYLFSYLKSIVKTDYGDRVEKWYNTLDEKDKLEFLEDCMNNHIYVEEPPMYGNTSLYDIEEVYDRFGFKPLKCYVEKFGKLKPMMRKVVVGDVYFLKLKHHLYILVVYKAS